MCHIIVVCVTERSFSCNFYFPRATVQENIDLIKLQREVKEKSTKLAAVTEKYSILEEVCSILIVKRHVLFTDFKFCGKTW
jgi:hypothetical protein